MQTGIHPQVFADAVIKCACGAVFHIPGVVKEMHVESCSKCHPFYTGTMKIMDAAGRIDKFKARQAAAQKLSKAA